MLDNVSKSCLVKRKRERSKSPKSNVSLVSVMLLKQLFSFDGNSEDVIIDVVGLKSDVIGVEIFVNLFFVPKMENIK